MTDLVGGQAVSVQSPPSSISFIKSGKIKVLGVVNEKRVPALPDSPTISETVKGSAPRRGTACLCPQAHRRRSSSN